MPTQQLCSCLPVKVACASTDLALERRGCFHPGCLSGQSSPWEALLHGGNPLGGRSQRNSLRAWPVRNGRSHPGCPGISTHWPRVPTGGTSLAFSMPPPVFLTAVEWKDLRLPLSLVPLLSILFPLPHSLPLPFLPASRDPQGPTGCSYFLKPHKGAPNNGHKVIADVHLEALGAHH